MPYRDELCYLCGGDGVISIGREVDEKPLVHGVQCPACNGNKVVIVHVDFNGLPASKRILDSLDNPKPPQPGV